MSFLNKYSSLLIVLLLSYFSIQPLFAPGFFSMHDDTQVARVYEMKTALADGMFPVRWVPDLGYNYGYPIFNFYGPLAYYVGGFFNLIGFNSLIATKIMIGLGTLIAGVFMYLLAREFWGKIGGIVSALLYIYAPYHALNIYVRGAIGELWAYGFIPLAFFGVYKVFQATFDGQLQTVSKPKLKSHKSKVSALTQVGQGKSQKLIWLWIAVASFGYAGIIVSHNLTAMMVTPFLFTFAIFLYINSRMKGNTRKSYFILLSLLLGVFLSAFYWLPVLFEMKYTNVLSVVGGGSDYKDHFVCLGQLWESQWGFGGSTTGCVDGMSFKIGKLHIILGLFALVPLFFMRSNRFIVTTITIAFVSAVIATFLITEYSKFIWNAIPHMAFFQFPWRFLVLTSFLLSFLGGALFVLFRKGWAVPGLIAVVIIIGIIVLNAKLFVPDEIYNKSSEDYTNKAQIVWETSKISDEYMPPGFQKPASVNEVPARKISEKEGVKFLSYNEKTQKVSAVIEVKERTELQVNIAYFPGWHVYVDDKQEYFKYYKKGLLVAVPEGKHTVDIIYSQTLVEKTGNALTLAGVLVLLAGIIFSRKDGTRV